MSQKKSTASESRARYWRSLDELQQTPEFEAWLHREFPVAASEVPSGVSRRRWLQLMGASMALGGAVGCRYEKKAIAPFVIRPEGRIPGEPHHTVTNIELAGRVYNLSMTGVDGRPVKVEGNERHPSSAGANDLFAQACVLGLYDPDRREGVSLRTGGKVAPSSWSDFSVAIEELSQRIAADGGAGMAVLAEPTRSPSQARLFADLMARFPKATVCFYSAAESRASIEAAERAIGQPADVVYELDQAQVVFGLEAELLTDHPQAPRQSRLWSRTRNPGAPGGMSRLYVAEGRFSPTGVNADSRLALPPSEAPSFLAELERRVDALLGGEEHVHAASDQGFDDLTPAERLETFLDVLAHDLVDHRGRSAVVVGERLGADAVLAGLRLNHKLGNWQKVVRFYPVIELPSAIGLKEFTDQLAGGSVNTVLVLGGNPVGTSPGDIALGAALEKATHSIYLGEYDDETAQHCQWLLPLAHPLESWGDVVTFDGHYGVSQPQILPLLDGRTKLEVLAAFAGSSVTDAQEIVRAEAARRTGGEMSNRQWRTLLHDGFDPKLTTAPIAGDYRGGSQPLTDASPRAELELSRDAMQVVFVPSPSLYDGRFANNGWLQEMPQQLTKVTWENVAVMSPRTARALEVWQGTLVAVRRGDDTVELPVYVLPGQAPGVITLAYGHGRTHVGHVGGHEAEGTGPSGVDVRPVRHSDGMWLVTAMEARPRSTTRKLSTTQEHWAIDPLGADETEKRSYWMVREGTSELFAQHPEFAAGVRHEHFENKSLWEEPMEAIMRDQPYLPQWGMAIDLNKCTGCSSCVIACQSENNVPIVGRDLVLMNREMQWLRIDRYFQGDEDFAQVVQQPVACQHCETAPCEQVCPVAATVHTEEGINAMAYNRCIGTRYCANNCPYKVRRFNYFNYNEQIGTGYGIFAGQQNLENANRKLQALVLNPDVSVRGRGVIEKCTYCIQRVERGKITARKEGGRPIKDGEVRTACQMACPTDAISFGNIMDQESVVHQQQADPRSYRMLGHLNVKPRTAYLARVRNVHPRLMTSVQRQQIDEFAHHGSEHGGAEQEVAEPGAAARS
jgi:molybdopterin-containing oxidoreductase family iron-sulfur binding subunit